MSYRWNRGLGAALDCSNVDGLIPTDAQFPFENCGPMDSSCVARNAKQDDAKNNAWQAYHDAVAACSAQKFQAGGGPIDTSKLTFGAGTDFTTGQVYTAPTAPESSYDQSFQPYQTNGQIAASNALMAPYRNAPTMFGPQAPVAPKPAVTVSSAPAPPVAPTVQSSSVPPAKQSQQPGISLPDGTDGTPVSSSFSLSDVPWYVWLLGGGAALWAVNKAA